jgi:ribosomal protein L24
MTKPFTKGDKVTVTSGKHTGKIGTVEHSDKSITTVRFGDTTDPVWTVNLERSDG